MIFLRITFIFTSIGMWTAIHFLGQPLPPSWSVLSSPLLHRKAKCFRDSDADIGSSSQQFRVTLYYIWVRDLWFPVCYFMLADFICRILSTCCFNSGISCSLSGIQHRRETANNQKQEMQLETKKILSKLQVFFFLCEFSSNFTFKIIKRYIFIYGSIQQDVTFFIYIVVL